MRIAILGSGGVGGYFGGRLAAIGTDVRFIARGAHLEALRARGLRIDSPNGDLHLPQVSATDDPAAIGPVDIVFFTVKLYDTEAALRLLPPLVGPQTLVISFQNGVDSVDAVVRAVGRQHVAGGTTYLAAVVSEPGVIRHTAMNRLIFGALDGERSPLLVGLAEACQRAGVDTMLSDRIMTDIWAKFVRLSVYSGMTAVTRCPIGPIRDDSALAEMMQGAVRESMAVARAKGVPLAAGLVEEIQAGTAALPAEAKSSMLEDLERGRRLELPWLSGAVVRLGKEVGVETPIHGFINTVLQPHVKGREGSVASGRPS